MVFVLRFDCDACCSPPCFYTHFYEPLALCLLRPSWRSDAASYRTVSLRPNPARSHQNAGSSQHFRPCTCSGRDCVERHVSLLRNPDLVKQNCKLSGYGDHSPSSRMAAASRPHAKPPLLFFFFKQKTAYEMI